MDQVTNQPAVLSDETSNLIRLFHEDCRLRKLVSTMDYPSFRTNGPISKHFRRKFIGKIY